MDHSSSARQTFRRGETVVVSTEVSNVGTSSMTFLMVAQVLNSQSEPVPPAYLWYTLEPGGHFTFNSAFMLPEDAVPGTWEVSAMVISDFISESGIAIAEPAEVDFTVDY